MDGAKMFLNEVSQKPGEILIPAALVYLLVPGNFVTIPGALNYVEMSEGPQNQKSLITHAVLFAVALALLRRNFPQYYL